MLTNKPQYLLLSQATKIWTRTWKIKDAKCSYPFVKCTCAQKYNGCSLPKLWKLETLPCDMDNESNHPFSYGMCLFET
jgi:hypothetical protein